MTLITAALVKELRERTSAGMMECKKALEKANGNIEDAIQNMRIDGQAKAVKKSGNVTSEGTIVVQAAANGKEAVIVEINSQTDFVSREDRFKTFAKKTAETALNSKIKTAEVLQEKLNTERLELITQLGENITIRRLAFIEIKDGVIGTYAHGDANGVRIGTAVILKKGDIELAKDLAMQVAAMNPEYLNLNEVPAERLEKEKEIFITQTREEGKPEAMLEKIVAGKIYKFSKEITLLGQAYVKDQNLTIEALLKSKNAEIESFVRFEVGEGIEKKVDNFAEEVMAQVRSS
jgi:elongation factor Ts